MELSKMFQNNTFPINFTFPNYTCFNFRSHFVEWRSIYQFYFYQSSIFEIEQNFGSGPGKIMWCENLKIGIQNGKEKCTIMTGPLIDYPFTEGTLACVLVYVWENTLRYGRTTCESYRFEPLWWLQRSKCFSF